MKLNKAGSRDGHGNEDSSPRTAIPLRMAEPWTGHPLHAFDNPTSKFPTHKGSAAGAHDDSQVRFNTVQFLPHHTYTTPPVMTESASTTSAADSSLPARHRGLPSNTVLILKTDLSSASRLGSQATQDPLPAGGSSYNSHLEDRTIAPTSASTPTITASISTASMPSKLSATPALSSPAPPGLMPLSSLPSPLVPGEPPTPWQRVGPKFAFEATAPQDEATPAGVGASRTLSISKRKAYQKLMPASAEAHMANRAEDRNVAAHATNRSLSEFIPEPLQNPQPRHVSAQGTPESSFDYQVASKASMHREKHLTLQRGLQDVGQPAVIPSQLPSPPLSNQSVTASEEGEHLRLDGDTDYDYLEIRVPNSKKFKRWRPVRQLGQGTFSKVVLATSERLNQKGNLDEEDLDPKKLVAIKVIEHGAAGGADEDRVENQLKREIGILRSISYPSVIHLKSFSVDEQRALLVLNYCPGGDLFELAAEHRELLRPTLIQRIFAELVGALRYLHEQLIVHRDIKLENVLVNLRASTLYEVKDDTTHPYPIVSLTDLGLSRRISPENPLLSTRCGSEDYAAPEILLGQEYDGRETDAWALGVLLYALMEGRLPFDPPPGKPPPRSRAAHRIARCDWLWVKFGDKYGEWVNEKGVGYEGARECVEGLLKKMGRKRLDEIAELQWVKEGIRVEGRLRMSEVDDDCEDEELASL